MGHSFYHRGFKIVLFFDYCEVKYVKKYKRSWWIAIPINETGAVYFAATVGRCMRAIDLFRKTPACSLPNDPDHPAGQKPNP